MTETATKLKVGDKVVFVARYGAKPVVATVCRVTPAGKFEIEEYKGHLFRPTRYTSDGGFDTGENYTSRFSDRQRCFLIDNLDECQKRYREDKKVLDEKKKEIAEKRVEQERLHQQRLDQVKTVMGNVDWKEKLFYTFENGARIYAFVVPIKKEYAERKGSHEAVFVKCEDDTDWEDKPTGKVRASFSRQDGRDQGFSCHGSFTVADDAEACWEAACTSYTDW